MIGVMNHFQRLAHWLKLESEAEAEQLEQRRRNSIDDVERSGETLLDLVMTDHKPDLGGRTRLVLVKRNRTLTLPWHRLRVGSPVLVTSTDVQDERMSGVVSGRRRSSIEVSVADLPYGEHFRLDLTPDEITRKRQAAALSSAQVAKGRTAQLRDVMLGEREPRFVLPSNRNEATHPLAQHLNRSQREAIEFALDADDLAIIHGPPGTGKTTTVVAMISQAVEQGSRVLACAPSNTAVDNLLMRLIASRHKVVRVGHPARVKDRLQDYTLDSQAADHPLMRVVRDMLREAEDLFRKAERHTRSKPAPGAKRGMVREAKRLRGDARLLEQQAIDSVLDNADVVCATTSFHSDLLGEREFDLAVIDEACQTTEPGCWIPLLRAEKIVLAGDHCQLPPTVLSAEAAREGLTTSMLERLVNHYGDKVTRRLDVQYRMHSEIMQFSSERFYDGVLQADETVACHLLSDLPHVESNEFTNSPVSFIDTAGGDWNEELEPEGLSKRNPSEATLVLKKVRELQAAGLRAEEIAVIAPYSAQVRWLRDQAHDYELEIDTVDGFQGREKEAVVISCVRSNSIGEIGFLGDARRMNVALTRARRKLIVIGDSATLGRHEFYTKLLAYFESIGAYGTIWTESLNED